MTKYKPRTVRVQVSLPTVEKIKHKTCGYKALDYDEYSDKMFFRFEDSYQKTRETFFAMFGEDAFISFPAKSRSSEIKGVNRIRSYGFTIDKITYED